MASTLLYLRKTSRLSQEKLAKILGISVWTYQQMENGKKRISTAQAEILAQLFQIDKYELTEIIDNKSLGDKYRDKLINRIKMASKDQLSEIDEFLNYLDFKYKNI